MTLGNAQLWSRYHTLWTDGETEYTREDLRWADRLLSKGAELVAMMQSGGVGLLAGTDLPPKTKNGTIHDELEVIS